MTRTRAKPVAPACSRSLNAPPVLSSSAGLWKTVRRLLVIRLDNIGDMVMLSPALRALHHAIPRTEIHLLASPAGSQVVELLPWVHEVSVHRAIWQDVSASLTVNVKSQQDLVESLRSKRFDAATIFTSFSQSPYPPAYVCYLAGIPLRLGQSREFGGHLLTHWVKPLPDETHQVDRNLHLLESVGIGPASRELELHVPARERQQVDELLGEVGLADESFIALAPGASCASRRYDPSRFAAVARQLSRAAGLPIAVLGSAKEADLARPICETGGQAIVSLVGRTTVPMLADVIRRSRLVMANDSSAMHLADAFKRPAVILFSGTDREEQWRPRHAPSRLLREPTPCAPCHTFACPHHMQCLDIRPSDVVKAALDLLARTCDHSGDLLPVGTPR